MEAAAAVPPNARTVLLAIKQAAENPQSARKRMVVVNQFNEWRGERAVTDETILEFLTANLSSGNYKPTTMWSRRSHLKHHYTLEYTPPIDFSKMTPSSMLLLRFFCVF